MKIAVLACLLVLTLAAAAWAGECPLPPQGQCSLAMDQAPSPVEVVNLNPNKRASVLGYWLYGAQTAPRRVRAGFKPGEAIIFSPPRVKAGQGPPFTARTLVLYNLGTTAMSARTVR